MVAGWSDLHVCDELHNSLSVLAGTEGQGLEECLLLLGIGLDVGLHL